MISQITVKVPNRIKDELEAEQSELVETYPTMSDYLRAILIARKQGGKIQAKLDEAIKMINPEQQERVSAGKSNEVTAYDKMLQPIFEHVEGKYLTLIDLKGVTKVYPIYQPSDIFKAVLSTIKIDF